MVGPPGCSWWWALMYSRCISSVIVAISFPVTVLYQLTHPAKSTFIFTVRLRVRVGVVGGLDLGMVFSFVLLGIAP